jgi:heme O synthase-like polyprenyltransferase
VIKIRKLTFAGFYLGCANAGLTTGSIFSIAPTLVGTLLVASGTATLNQSMERKFDAQMRRTARRPAAAGRLEPHAVLAFGIVLSAAGSIYLALAVNALPQVRAVDGKDLKFFALRFAARSRQCSRSCHLWVSRMDCEK